MRRVVRLAGWAIGVPVALLVGLLAVNMALVLALFGPEEGARRLTSDWTRITLAHQVAAGRLTTEAAFARAYGRDLGPSPAPEEIRAYVARDIETGEPAAFDVIMARYVLARFGAIDGRTLPPGAYLAAGPIGPDAWPGPLATQYLLFPRHGYLLVVPNERDGRWPEAYEATASLRKEFRRTGDQDALYGVVQPYRPAAYDFPTPGEPIHDLLLISQDEQEIADIEGRLRTFSRRLDKRGLSYELLRRNSNSALACYLRATGLDGRIGAGVRPRLLLRLRLPGIARSDRLPC